MEQNEAGYQAPILCVNNCGFFGTVTTMNMCSKCYKDMVLKEEQAKLAASSIQSIVNGGGGSSSVDVTLVTCDGPSESKTVTTQVSCALPENVDVEKVKEGPKRCNTCRKRVGLTGFNCRCGNHFCSVHRYSDKHDCPFDYQQAAQTSIAKANPVVKGEKLDKI